MRVCSIAREYLQAGRIICEGQYFAFPDKSHIQQVGNETFKQVIDTRYAMPTSPTPATGSNAIPVNTSQCKGTFSTLTKIPSSAFISESYFLGCIPIPKNHAVVVTIKEEQKSEVLAITRSKMKNAPTMEIFPIKKPVSSPAASAIHSPANDD
jgi:hypothetical protein